MNAITVTLNYHLCADAPRGRGDPKSVALPIKVLNEEGTILAEELVSSAAPAEFEIDHEAKYLYVRLTWPGGRMETRKATESANGQFQVAFSDSSITHNEWSAWAAPRLNWRTSFKTKGQADAPIRQYANVWLRLWRKDDDGWQPAALSPDTQYKSELAKQVDCHLDAKPYLLQLGSAEIPWQFVALPGGGPCRILFTPNESADPRADVLKVVVTSFRADAETLIEFLSRDAIRASSTMANSSELAVSLFADKFNDPVAAVVGAYYLLKVDDVERVPLIWWQNLSDNFPWIPDTAILHCSRLLRDGLANDAARAKVLRLFRQCLDRGWPIYAEGLRLLQDAASLLRHVAGVEDAEYFSRVDLLATAKAWAGASLSFHGMDPSRPSAVLWVGNPGSPQQRHVPSAEVLNILSEPDLTEDAESAGSTASTVNRQLSSLSFIADTASDPTSRTRAGLESLVMIGNPTARRIWNTGSPGTPVPGDKSTEASEGWMTLGDIGDTM